MKANNIRLRDSAPLRRQLSASQAGPPPLTKSLIRTWIYWPFWDIKAALHSSCFLALTLAESATPTNLLSVQMFQIASYYEFWMFKTVL